METIKKPSTTELPSYYRHFGALFYGNDDNKAEMLSYVRGSKDILSKAAMKSMMETEGSDVGKEEYDFFGLCQTMFQALARIEWELQEEIRHEKLSKSTLN